MSETNPEDLYPPKPGGMVDTVRKQKQAEQDQLAALEQSPGIPAVLRRQIPVNVRVGELARARTFSIATGNSNPVVELLGRDDNRYAGTIMTLDEPVVIAFSQTAADDPRNAVNAAGLSANGFVLPVNVPYPVAYKGVVYAVATSSTATRVSVSAFSYAEP